MPTTHLLAAFGGEARNRLQVILLLHADLTGHDRSHTGFPLGIIWGFPARPAGRADAVNTDVPLRLYVMPTSGIITSARRVAGDRHSSRAAEVL